MRLIERFTIGQLKVHSSADCKVRRRPIERSAGSCRSLRRPVIGRTPHRGNLPAQYRHTPDVETRGTRGCLPTATAAAPSAAIEALHAVTLTDVRFARSRRDRLLASRITAPAHAAVDRHLKNTNCTGSPPCPATRASTSTTCCSAPRPRASWSGRTSTTAAPTATTSNDC